jgi:hypothetical protein
MSAQLGIGHPHGGHTGSSCGLNAGQSVLEDEDRRRLGDAETFGGDEEDILYAA